MATSLRARSIYYKPSDGSSSIPQMPPVPKERARLAKGGRPAVNQRRTTVHDKLKKRMSMRYADISGPLETEGIPAVPALPDIREFRTEPRQTGEYDREDYSGPRGRDDQAAEVRGPSDVELLSADDFDPDAFLKIKLAHSTEDEIQSLQYSLAATRDATASDLKRSVYEHYADFVLISKEISTLENELLELKESLSEWKSMPALLKIEDESGTSTALADRRRTAVRSSIADLRTLYANQLNELHGQIEGSSKFTPVIPDRHIVSEFSDLWSLNSATYKIEYAVHMVLLNDSLLVAKKRKKRSGNGGKLVAERCWPLNEITMGDVKDTVDLTSVIKVRRGKETHVFKTDNHSDKKTLLSLFRQVSEELSTKKKKERESEHERRRSVWTGDRMSMAPGSEPMPALPAWLVDLQNKGLGIPGLPGSDKSQEKDVRWVNDFVDKLAVAIALREWEEAVSLVEQGGDRSSECPPSPSTHPLATFAGQAVTQAPASTLLPPRLQPLKASLVSDLLAAISDPSNRKQSIVKISSYLTRLGSGIAARDAFLSTRAELMRKRARMIRFEGNIALYIRMVNWGREQIENYAMMFRRQVYGPDVDSKTIQESVQVTRMQAKRLLQDIGLDFSFVLDGLLAPPPNAPVPRDRRPSQAGKNLPEPAPTPVLALPKPHPLALQTRSRSPGFPSPGLAQPKSPGVSQTPMRAPVPLPPRSRERPMSGNVQPKSRENTT
ncbi:exocyst complex component exo84 [Tulasnella sp. UAMH 9824]|nr:exocyst complex component exo84 [Tulasnella sp. UAMH 9824]